MQILHGHFLSLFLRAGWHRNSENTRHRESVLAALIDTVIIISHLSSTAGRTLSNRSHFVPNWYTLRPWTSTLPLDVVCCSVPCYSCTIVWWTLSNLCTTYPDIHCQAEDCFLMRTLPELLSVIRLFYECTNRYCRLTSWMRAVLLH